MITLALVAALVPVTGFAYSYSGGSRSFSAPSRSYSSFSSGSSFRSFSVPTRSYTAPSAARSFTVPARTYSAPTTISAAKSESAYVPTSNITPSVSTGGSSWNPLSGNFWFYYWLFGNHGTKSTIIYQSATTSSSTNGN